MEKLFTRQKTNPVLFGILLFFSCCIYSFSQTTVPGGNVSGTWTLAGSPYLVMGSIQIPNGQTLSIDPGVLIEFQGQYPFNVQGRLLALGAVTDTIVFTAANTIDGWIGIHFDNTSITNDTSKIKYCKLQYATSNAPYPMGGAFLFDHFSKAIISNSRISDCTASSGGGIYCLSSSPIIIRNTISNNSGPQGGGGITCLNQSNPTISNNIISNNSAVSASMRGGGGIYCDKSNPYIIKNTITDNFGGGIYCVGSNPIITSNTISNNTASSLGVGGGGGGGIYCEGSDPVIEKNVISNNLANTIYSSGGGICCQSSNPIINNNIISNNTSSGTGTGGGSGGGISCLVSNPSITNNTISNNSAINGGAISFFQSSSPTLYNNILFGNTASSSGAQVCLLDQASDPNFYYCDVQGGAAAFGFNGNSYTGIYQNNININPVFVSPSSGSGTGFNGVTADWSLQPSSSCIDKGNPNGTYPATDKAGNPRVRICRIDMGAYEYQSGTPFSVTITQTQQIFCHGDASAALLANPLGGTSSDTYSYAWSTGSTSQLITGLSAGVHSLTVSTTVSQCRIVASYTVSEPSQIIVAPSHKDDNACNVINDGVASIHVTGGKIPYTFLWSTSNTTNSISGLTPGNYSVTINDNNGCTATNTISVGTLSTTITAYITTIPDTCTAGVGKITTTPTGGLGSYTYAWSNGSSAHNISGLSPGSFTVVISDSLGCISANSPTVGVYTNTITTTFTSVPASCHNADGSVTVFSSGGTNPYSYNWSSGSSAQLANNLIAANYTVDVTDKNGCNGSGNFTVGTSSLISTPAICMVTVDSLSQSNAIMWDKTPYSHIDSFIVYRETSANNYKPIGAVPYDSLSLFVDTVRTKYFPNTGDPNAGTYRYKLKMVDSCGNYSQLSPFHNTIYIINNGGTFSWPQLYTIEGGSNPVSNYVLMRDNNSNGNWIVISSVTGSQQTVTDPQYAAYQTTASWRVETQWNISCIPTRILFSDGTFNASRSNIFSHTTIGVYEYYNNPSVNIFPNPFTETAILQIINEKKSANYEIQLFDIYGKEVMKHILPKGENRYTIEQNGLASGMYFYKLSNENTIVATGKLSIK